MEIRYDANAEVLFDKSEQADNVLADSTKPLVYLHELPIGAAIPLYITDKQREGVVKSFSNLTDEELNEYETVSSRVLKNILTDHTLDILHCNHVTYLPQIAEKVCAETETPREEKLLKLAPSSNTRVTKTRRCSQQKATCHNHADQQSPARHWEEALSLQRPHP